MATDKHIDIVKNNTLSNKFNQLNSQLHSQLNSHCQLDSVKINELFNQSEHGQISLQIGVDEAGRGPLLGSVLVGAVLLPPEYSGELETMNLQNTPLAKLNDSKKISEKKRNQLYETLPSVALGYVSVDVPATVIDDINILQASLLGMRMAVYQLLNDIACTIDKKLLTRCNIELLFDGNKLPVLDFESYQAWGFNLNNIKAEAVVKGDGKFASIASASVIAKVERDQQMYQMATRYPDYGIDKHKGYPTKAHFEALEKYGVLAEHRKSFSPVRKRLNLD